MTTDTKQKFFLVNKLDHNLSLKGGYLIIPGYGYATLNEGDATENTVVYAIGRQWAELTKTEPKHQAVRKEIDITVDSPYEGMTEAELLASRVPAPVSTPVVEPVPAVVGEDVSKTVTPAKAKKAAE